jgi:uncharacterized membrane protein YedE/YeeE
MNATAAAPRVGTRHFLAMFFGMLLGFVVSSVGFTNYDHVHAMFTFADQRMLFAFAGSVVVISGCFFLMRRRRVLPNRPIHKGNIPGGVIFGVGWALTGVCPGVVFSQLGEGRAPALFTLVGVVAGSVVYRLVHGRFFRWDRGSC